MHRPFGARFLDIALPRLIIISEVQNSFAETKFAPSSSLAQINPALNAYTLIHYRRKGNFVPLFNL